MLITSGVNLRPFAESQNSDAKETEIDGLSVLVSASDGTKCARCWHYLHDVGTVEAHPEICGRCVENIDGAGETRQYA